MARTLLQRYACEGVTTVCVRVRRGMCVSVCIDGAYIAAKGCVCAYMRVGLSVQ